MGIGAASFFSFAFSSFFKHTGQTPVTSFDFLSASDLHVEFCISVASPPRQKKGHKVDISSFYSALINIQILRHLVFEFLPSLFIGSPVSVAPSPNGLLEQNIFGSNSKQ